MTFVINRTLFLAQATPATTLGLNTFTAMGETNFSSQARVFQVAYGSGLPNTVSSLGKAPRRFQTGIPIVFPETVPTSLPDLGRDDGSHSHSIPPIPRIVGIGWRSYRLASDLGDTGMRPEGQLGGGSQPHVVVVRNEYVAIPIKADNYTDLVETLILRSLAYAGATFI